MKAIILAAGRGSRLHPYTSECPKCLTELGGRTLIGRQLGVMRDCGISDITIASGYHAEMLALDGTTQVVNDAWASTNMVETLFVAEDAFGDDLIVAYSDIIYERGVLNTLMSSDAPISVVVDKKWRAYWEYRFADPLSDAESLKLSEDGKILDIGAKEQNIENIEAQYIGLMRFKGVGIEQLRQARQSLLVADRAWKRTRPVQQAYMTDLLMEMILLGHSLQSVPIENGWLEIDTVEDYEKAQEDFDTGAITKFFSPQ